MDFFTGRIMKRSICFDLFGGGGGGQSTQSTQTVYQETELSKTQAQILKDLAPYLTTFGMNTIPALQTFTGNQMHALNTMLQGIDIPAITNLQNMQTQGQTNLMQYLAPQLMQQLQGQPTSQQVQNLSNTQNMLRQNMANVGVRAGDPRMVQGMQQGQGALTKPSNDPIVSTLMSLYGGGTGGLGTAQTASMGTPPNVMNPQGLIAMMGANPIGGSTSKGQGTAPSATGLDYLGAGLNTALTAALMYNLLGSGGFASLGDLGILSYASLGV